MLKCPVCNKSVAQSTIELHVDKCLSESESNNSSSEEHQISLRSRKNVETRPPIPRPRPRPEPSRPRPRPDGSRPRPRPRPPKTGLETARDQDRGLETTSLRSKLENNENFTNPDVEESKRLSNFDTKLSQDFLPKTVQGPTSAASGVGKSLTNISQADIATSSKTSNRPLQYSRCPLAEAMRPKMLEEYIGQEEVLGEGSTLRRIVEGGRFTSLILWGPPGCGKTTLARLIANQCKGSDGGKGWKFVPLSATTCGIADVKECIKVAKNEQTLLGRRTILFIDEIHRFNKLQQDTFLPHVEDGTITLIGATTENPSFQVNNALLSRCKVVALSKLNMDSVVKILYRAVEAVGLDVIDDSNNNEAEIDVMINHADVNKKNACKQNSTSITTKAETVENKRDGFNWTEGIEDDFDGEDMAEYNCYNSGYTAAGKNQPRTGIEKSAIELIARRCDGDARRALNTLQLALDAYGRSDGSGGGAGSGYGRGLIRLTDVLEVIGRSHVQYDKTGEEHYNCASALQKSIRASDDNAALYWLTRMLEGGEDILFIARRLVVIASEDVGLADNAALPLAVATFQACHLIGMPECALNLSHCTTYLARAPKSRQTTTAYHNIQQLIANHNGPQPSVPLHLRNVTPPGMVYKQNKMKAEDSMTQRKSCLPPELAGRNFFS